MCFTHKQSFLPLSPAIERDTLARRDGGMDGGDGWSGEELNGSVGSRTAHFMPGVTDLFYDFARSTRTECDFHNVIFYPLYKTGMDTQKCKISAHCRMCRYEAVMTSLCA